MKKQILTLSKKDIKKLIVRELERILPLESTKTNRCQKSKMYIIYDMIKKADDDLTVKVEGVRGNHKIRDFELFNSGSMVECLVKHYRKGYINTFKSFDDKSADEWDGIMDYEIKASLPNARNTADHKNRATLLINCKGAFVIKKNAVVETDSKNKYYENLDYSKFDGCRRIETLTKKLGLA